MRGNGETDFTPRLNVGGDGTRREQESKHCTEVYQGHGNVLSGKLTRHAPMSVIGTKQTLCSFQESVTALQAEMSTHDVGNCL